MTMQRTHLLVLATAGAVLLAGCAEFPIFDQKQARTPSHPKAVAARSAPAAERERDREDTPARDNTVAESPRESNGLRDGIRLYNEGDFNGAIKRLSARDVNTGPTATRVTALKYLAFSYCVTSRPAPCRQAFERALRLDPGFDLAPGEHGHPLWGPVFTQAKQAVAAR
jgi:hypothetical protein